MRATKEQLDILYGQAKILLNADNIPEALSIFTEAADGGCVKSQATLGAIYSDDETEFLDHDKAFKYTKMAAENGRFDMQYNLSIMYFNGEGVEQSETEGNRWLESAAGGNCLEAQALLGSRCLETNSQVAVVMLQSAAVGGIASAQYYLGVLFNNGSHGLPENFEKSAYWLSKASLQGFKAATEALVTIDPAIQSAMMARIAKEQDLAQQR